MPKITPTFVWPRLLQDIQPSPLALLAATCSKIGAPAESDTAAGPAQPPAAGIRVGVPLIGEAGGQTWLQAVPGLGNVITMDGSGKPTVMMAGGAQPSLMSPQVIATPVTGPGGTISYNIIQNAMPQFQLVTVLGADGQEQTVLMPMSSLQMPGGMMQAAGFNQTQLIRTPTGVALSNVVSPSAIANPAMSIPAANNLVGLPAVARPAAANLLQTVQLPSGLSMQGAMPVQMAVNQASPAYQTIHIPIQALQGQQMGALPQQQLQQQQLLQLQQLQQQQHLQLQQQQQQPQPITITPDMLTPVTGSDTLVAQVSSTTPPAESTPIMTSVHQPTILSVPVVNAPSAVAAAATTATSTPEPQVVPTPASNILNVAASTVLDNSPALLSSTPTAVASQAALVGAVASQAGLVANQAGVLGTMANQAGIVASQAGMLATVANQAGLVTNQAGLVGAVANQAGLVGAVANQAGLAVQNILLPNGQIVQSVGGAAAAGLQLIGQPGQVVQSPWFTPVNMAGLRAAGASLQLQAPAVTGGATFLQNVAIPQMAPQLSAVHAVPVSAASPIANNIIGEWLHFLLFYFHFGLNIYFLMKKLSQNLCWRFYLVVEPWSTYHPAQKLFYIFFKYKIILIFINNNIRSVDSSSADSTYLGMLNFLFPFTRITNRGIK